MKHQAKFYVLGYDGERLPTVLTSRVFASGASAQHYADMAWGMAHERLPADTCVIGWYPSAWGKAP